MRSILRVFSLGFLVSITSTWASNDDLIEIVASTSDPLTRQMVLWKIYDIEAQGSRVIETSLLVKLATQDSAPEVRRTAVDGLARRVSEWTPELTNTVIEIAVNDPDRSVRQYAAYGVGKTGIEPDASLYD